MAYPLLATSPLLPDLIITDISWSPAEPVEGDLVTFSATILNQGTAPTPTDVPIRVAFRVDGVVVSWSDGFTGPLAPGESTILTANDGPV